MTKPCARCGMNERLKDGRCAPCRRNRERKSGVETPDKLVLPRGFICPEDSKEITSSYQGELPKKLLVDGDTHYPIVDRQVELAKMKFAQHVRPDLWISVGDLFDVWSLSRFVKEPKRWKNGSGFLQHEFDSARPYLKEISNLCPMGMEILQGNHERRLIDLVTANMGLFELRALDFSKLAELPSNVRVHDYGKKIRIGPLTMEHGDTIARGKEGIKSPAEWHFANRGTKSIIAGHFHRSEVRHRTIFDEEGNQHSYVAIIQGHGSDVKQQTYVSEPNWVCGFTYVEFWKDYNGRDRFTAHPITIVDGCFSWGGKLFSGKKP